MIDKFRNLILIELNKYFTDLQLIIIKNAIDNIAIDYNIESKSTDLSVVGRQLMLQLMSLYTIIRKSLGVSQTTLKTNGIILRKFAYECTVPINQVTTNMIRAWLYNYQTSNNVSSRTLDLYRIVICSFFKWLNAEGYIEKDITSNINKIKYQPARRKALTQLQLLNIRHACNTDRLRCLVLLLYSTGCRVSLILHIKINDIDWNNKQILVIGKGNKVRIVYLNAKALYAIKTYLSNRKILSLYLIAGLRNRKSLSKESIERIFRGIAIRAGMNPKDLSPHIMRHTMATQAATTCPIQQVQRMLGHSSINTTMIYAEVHDEAVRNGHLLSVI